MSRRVLLQKGSSGWAPLDESHKLPNDELNVWVSEPPPPPDLWDTNDFHCMDRVKCNIKVELTNLDSRIGWFDGRMTCFWMFRSPCLGDSCQPRMRAPGLRTQRLVTDVLESRIWRISSKEDTESIFWRGMTIISFSGYKFFEVHDFPFDRQVIDMDTFEFVWRTSPYSDTYEEAMKVVYLSVATQSILPGWDSFPCILTPLKTIVHEGPSYVPSFRVRLRLQRKPHYYIWQIFMVTYLILTASLLPLGLKPGAIHIGDRLALHANGMLTLVTFKWTVNSDLPVVPYTTFATRWMFAQIITLALVAIEALLAYEFCSKWGIADTVIDTTENCFLLVCIGGWGLWALQIAHFKKHPEWSSVMAVQERPGELKDESHGE